MIVETYAYEPEKVIKQPKSWIEAQEDFLYNGFDPLANHDISRTFFDFMGFHYTEQQQ